MASHDAHLQIGSLQFEGVDQLDLTGPFEVFSLVVIGHPAFQLAGAAS